MIPALKVRQRQTLEALAWFAALDELDPRCMQALAMHESKLDWLVEHRLEADQRAARVAFERERKRYAGSPYAVPELAWLWLVGRGPLGMVPAYHVHLYDVDASPMVLHDPGIAALVGMRRVVRLVAYRAKQGKGTTWQHVHRSWKYGSSEPPNVTADELAVTDAKWREYVGKLYPVAEGETPLADRDVEPRQYMREGVGQRPGPLDAKRLQALWAALDKVAPGRPDPVELSARLSPATSGAYAAGSGVGLVVALGALGIVAVTGAAMLLSRR